MEIHQLIRTAMSDKQWTNAELAEACSVAEATAARWANGAITPKPRRWPDIEEALDLPAGAIARVYYGGEASPPDPELAAIVEDLQQDHLELAEMVRDLTRRVAALERAKGSGGRARPTNR